VACWSRRSARKLALYDLRDHADQPSSHGHAAGRRHGRNAPNDQAVGHSSCWAKRSRPCGDSDVPVGSAIKLLSWSDEFEPTRVGLIGRIPITFPWFDPSRHAPTAPQHGFARTATWHLIGARTRGASHTSWPLRRHPIGDALYAEGLRCLGEKGLLDLAMAGCYHLVCGVLNDFAIRAPDNRRD